MGSERSRVALVTGAGSGIGRAFAEKLAKDGESVVVNDLEEEDAKEAAARIEEEGGRTTAAPGDVSEPEDVRKIVEAAREIYGPVEVLVSNAGFLQQQPFVDLTVEDFDRMISVHLRGTFLCIHAVLPEMLSAGRGVVVNIASQLGQIGAEGLAHYAAANAGIIGLTESPGPRSLGARRTGERGRAQPRKHPAGHRQPARGVARSQSHGAATGAVRRATRGGRDGLFPGLECRPLRGTDARPQLGRRHAVRA